MQQETWIPIDDDPLLPAALAALGFVVRANVHLHPDAPTQAAHKTVTWMIAPQSGCGKHLGQQLIPAWRDKSILASSPDHPLVACMLALQTRQRLSDWQHGVIEKPHVVILSNSKLARATAPSDRTRAADITPHLAGEGLAMALDHAAAAITAGHGIVRMKPGSCVVTSKNAFSSDIQASVFAAAAAKIEATPAASASIVIGSNAPGEHPFLYALCAIKQARALGIAAEKKDPTLHLVSKTNGKTALVSQSIMDGNHSFQHHVHKHLR